MSAKTEDGFTSGSHYAQEPSTQSGGKWGRWRRRTAAAEEDKGVTWLSVQIFHTPKFNDSADEQQQWFPFFISLLSYSLILRLSSSHLSVLYLYSFFPAMQGIIISISFRLFTLRVA
ncbi:hypothetical protein I308_103859 [Cryptococcus tetragattii IND107]|uniref:Uncharacterized protein n=1 Tax=Cryptococcus tetragattii IND107 TaxID=1296105 RepID=A0ABR3BRF7_9TREE